jgi:hypothetical protein
MEEGELKFGGRAVVITSVEDSLTTIQDRIKHNKRLSLDQISSLDNAAEKVDLAVGICPFYLSGKTVVAEQAHRGL